MCVKATKWDLGWVTNSPRYELGPDPQFLFALVYSFFLNSKEGKHSLSKITSFSNILRFYNLILSLSNYNSTSSWKKKNIILLSHVARLVQINHLKKHSYDGSHKHKIEQLISVDSLYTLIKLILAKLAPDFVKTNTKMSWRNHTHTT